MSLLNMLTRRTRGRSSLVDLYAPGASEGDVLTVGADGSLSPAAPANGGSQTVNVATVEVESADLLALPTNIELLPAAAGVAHLPVLIVVHYNYGTTPYTQSDVQYRVYVGDSYGAADLNAGQSNWLNGTADALSLFNFQEQGLSGVHITDLTSTVGKAVNLGSFNTPTDGDGTLTITLYYVDYTP